MIFNNQYLSETTNQKLLDELINKKTRTYTFECEYLVNVDTGNMVYNYILELGKNEDGTYGIKHESLRCRSGNYANSIYKTIYETKNGELITLGCSGEQKTKIEKMTYNLLDKSLFVCSYIVGLKSVEDTDMGFLVHMVLLITFSVMIKVYLGNEDQHELYFLKKLINDTHNKNDRLLKNMGDAIKNLNVYLSVNDRTVNKEYFEQYKNKIAQLTRFLRLFKKELVDIEIDKKDDGDNYRCDLNLNYGDYVINKEFESTGIKKLIELYDCFDAADGNGIVFIDEMDSNLNDVYLCRLIEYFMYYGNGQLCFTTHNLDPMNILKENKNSIDFLSSDNHLVSWVSKGNASPDNYYRNGMIEDSPFNIEATDFMGMFGE